MKCEDVILQLKQIFGNDCFTETLLNDEFSFVYETEEKNDLGKVVRKYTEMCNIQPSIRHFNLKNTDRESLTAHICIDGDFVEYGQEKYNNLSENYSDGRPDSLVFNNTTFLFLELKVEQEDITAIKEDPKWATYLKGASQILDFVTFLRNNGFEIKAHYTNIFAVVCFRFAPNFSVMSRSNAQRNNLVFRISLKLGFPLKAHNHEDIFEI